MKGTKKVIIIGGGGHAKVVIDAVKESEEFTIYGVVDNYLKIGTSVLGIKVIGRDDDLYDIYAKEGIKYAFIGIGSIGDCHIRKKIYKVLKDIGFNLPVIKHPDAIISKEVFFEEGAFVAARAVINPGTYIGKNAIVNTASSIDHDCIIGDFVHIAPGAILCGGVRVGKETHIGAGANVIQGIEIGKCCMIGAGTTVRHNMLDGTKIFGTVKKREKKVFIIAEAGVNHNGDIDIAKKMVDAAKECGADAIKFQTFKAEKIVSKYTPKAEYQSRYTGKKGSQLSMLKKLELSEDAHRELMAYCDKKDIKFLSSPFDLESIELLARLGIDIFKIPSGQLTDLPYLRKVGALRKRVIISTGMSDLREIKEALDILVNAGTPKKEITVLHCNTEYPTPYKDVNLYAMITIGNTLKVKVGYSDHSLGIEVPIAAVALGAEVIEKHFTLDKNMAGPDHRASLSPEEFKAMVRAIRDVEESLGNGVKRPTPSELKNRDLVRKSIIASKDIRRYESFTNKNLATKRPAWGISPMEWDNVVGKSAKKDFKKGEFIEL